MRAAQNPVTPANTPVIAAVFAKHPVINNNASSTPKKTSVASNEEEVTEKMKTLGN